MDVDSILPVGRVRLLPRDIVCRCPRRSRLAEGHRREEAAIDAKLTPRRRVDYDNALTAGWTKFLINTPRPERVLVWVAGHLSGPWSFRLLSSAEAAAALIDEVPEGHLVFVLAFQDPNDADVFELRYVAPEGHA